MAVMWPQRFVVTSFWMAKQVVYDAAYFLLACWWAYVAWRPEGKTAVAHAATLRKLELRAL